MSWIFGFIGDNAESQLQTASDILSNSVLKKQTDSFFICAGGNERTINFQESANGEFSFFAGIGILKQKNGFSFLNSNKLTYYHSSFNEPDQINGHFVAVNYSNNLFEINTDKLGLREIFYHQTSNGLFISTRIDWLNRFTRLKIDPQHFGSRWNTFHQLSMKSAVSGCKRLVSGASLQYNPKTKKLTTAEFPIKFEDLNKKFSSDEFEETLNLLSTFPAKLNHNLTLSLSGGTDSRLLLSILLNQKSIKWDTHTFGDAAHPDAILAKQMAGDLEFEHKMLQQEKPTFDQVYKELKEYTAITQVNNPASAILQLRNYDLISDRNAVIIDGCIGEIWRREFLYKLQIKGAGAIRRHNVKSFLNTIIHARADIFSNDYTEAMKNGMSNDLISLFGKLPAAEKVGVLNWIDFFAIQTRFPNYFGPEQTYLDYKVVCFMPFIQLSLMKMVFGLQESERKNGRYFKRFIKRYDNRLSKYNLVKGVFNVPFKANSFEARALTMLMKKFSTNIYENKNQEYFLELFKEYILDKINSKSVAESDCYDYSKIATLTNNFYAGQRNLANQLDWFISFEIFRELLANE